MSAALLTKLIEAGTPPELIAEVAMELSRAQATSELIEQRRAKDRERKRVPRIPRKSTEDAEIQPPPKDKKSNPPSSVAIATVGEADPLKELFDVGVSVLTAAGHSERQARSLIGKWRKHGEEQVLTALIACKTKSISNPVEWITKSLSGSSGYVSESGYHYRGSEDQVLRQAEARADWNTYWSIKKKAAVHAQA
jgi:hypothetical protein